MEDILEKVIVLAANNLYIDKVTTTIKSIVAHNDGIHFYIINDDFPNEWFQLLNKKLKKFQSTITNVKKLGHHLNNYHLPTENLHYAAYFRYFIADFVKESRALYLDSDIIVRGNLDSLFKTDFENQYIAAVQDITYEGYLGDGFNSGVLLLNLEKWREEDTPMSQQLLELTEKYHQDVYGDQGILNIRFKNQWKSLDKKYNYMVGSDASAYLVNNLDWYTNSFIPKIIHYTGRKPWNELCSNRFRETWWFYYGLSWEDILCHLDLYNEDFSQLINKKKYTFLLLTYTAELLNINHLIEAFPDAQFFIAAKSNFAPQVLELQSYGNVTVIPYYNPFNLKELIEKMDIYLELGFGGEQENIIASATNKGIPVFGFQSTCHSSGHDVYIYEDSDYVGMINKIQESLGLKN